MTPGQQCCVTGTADRKGHWYFGETSCAHHPPGLGSPQLSRAYFPFTPQPSAPTCLGLPAGASCRHPARHRFTWKTPRTRTTRPSVFTSLGLLLRSQSMSILIFLADAEVSWVWTQHAPLWFLILITPEGFFSCCSSHPLTLPWRCGVRC